MKILLSVSKCLGKFTIFDLHRIRENKRKTNFYEVHEVRPLLYKIGQNSAEALSGRSTFYSALLSYAAENRLVGNTMIKSTLDVVLYLSFVGLVLHPHECTRVEAES
jgi:hypothetical protein